MFENWDWEDTASTILAGVVITAFVIVCMLITSSKNVTYYYLSNNQVGLSNNQVGTGVCVKAHWEWNPDSTVYCTDDKDKALDFVVKANATLPNTNKVK
jgi:hypothetical protein